MGRNALAAKRTVAVPKVTAAQMRDAWAYARDYYKNPEVIADYEMLARYRPEVVHGYLTLRRAAFNVEPTAALSPKMKELVILAIEIARTKVNPPPVGHAKRAVDSGATPAEVAEVTALCILIAGMLTFQESGRFALRAAEERYVATVARAGKGRPLRRKDNAASHDRP
jgi:alkylhydroperoxidase/carboxymuconolactone decarboxylase family protein YurZ